MDVLGKEVQLRLIRIPSYSLVFVRGDVFHSGGGGVESKGERYSHYNIPLCKTVNYEVEQHMTHRLSDIEKSNEELVTRFYIRCK